MKSNRHRTFLRQGLNLILVLVAGVLFWEAYSASTATVCQEILTDDCYPFGAEGPSADFWFYTSKSAYLGTLGVLIAGTVGLFLRSWKAESL